MKSKEQQLLEEAYQSIQEAISSRRARAIDAMHFKPQSDMPPTASTASAKDYFPHNSNDHEGEAAHIKVICANVSELLDGLKEKLESLYGGKDFELPPEIDKMFADIQGRLEEIVPTEDY